MHAEREHLKDFVFPALAERLRERYHHLEAIDLRWGVETTSMEEEGKRETLVLTVCLGEIARSRPFLIGLLGDRYGWIPPEARARAAASEAGLETDVAGKSITALEIEHGVLASRDQRCRSRFYFRNPLPYDKMPQKEAAKYSDLHSAELGGREAHDRLEELKTRIAVRLPDRVRKYDATWDGETGKVTDLGEWGRQVTEDLWEDLEAETREFEGQPRATWQQEEAFILEQFVETQCRDFVGRTEILDEILEFTESEADENAEWCYSVTGASGSGKSALFAELKRRLDKRGATLLAHAAGISFRSGHVESLLRRWTGELAGHLGIEDPSSGQADADVIGDIFPDVLNQVASQRRVVCLIDALNQFDATPMARHLTWLPKLWPQNARLITTAIPGFESAALEKRHGVRASAMSELREAEVKEIARTVCLRYHKKPHKEIVAALAEKKTSAGKPAAGLPLWLELAIDHLLLLQGDDFERAELVYPGHTAGERLHAMMLDEARSLPTEIGDLYGRVLARAERVYGEKLARGCATLIGLSRTGWREADLAAMLPVVTEEEWSLLRFVALRRGLRTHLVQRGASAQWDFAHTQAREAALRRYAPHDDERRTLHTAMAEHLQGLESFESLRQTETMYHWIAAEDVYSAAGYYGSWREDEEEEGAADALKAVLMRDRVQGSSWGLSWVGRLLDAAGVPNSALRIIAYKCVTHLDSSLENEADLALRNSVLLLAERSLLEQSRRDPASVECTQYLAICYRKLGELCARKGDQNQAAYYYERVLQLNYQLYNENPDSTEHARDLAVSCILLGDLWILLGHGDAAKAREYYERAERLHEDLYQRDSDSVVYTRDLSAVCSRLGEICANEGDSESARTHYERALELAARVLESTSSADSLRLISVICEKLGTVWKHLGDFTQACRCFEGALTLSEELYHGAPYSITYANGLAVCCQKMGDLQVDLGNQKRARSYYERALTVSEELRVRVPDSAEYARDVGVICERLGHSCLDSGDRDSALGYYKRSLELADALYYRAPDSAPYARDLVLSIANLFRVTKLSSLKFWRWRQAKENAAAAAFYADRLEEVLLKIKAAGIPVDEEMEQQIQLVRRAAS
jgi:tetratricopeptide (TPR) repeat protein